MTQFVKRTMLVATFLIATFSLSVQAQDDKAYEAAKKEIIEQFGAMPSMFEAFPKNALPSAWETFKHLHNDKETVIPPKYRELIQLGVAAQIPCVYCLYFHTESAKAYGATDEEIKEAIAQAASTRHWSTVIQGNQIDYDEFKKEFDAMMKHMSKKSKK